MPVPAIIATQSKSLACTFAVEIKKIVWLSDHVVAFFMPLFETKA
jgi:hypothetical protein